MCRRASTAAAQPDHVSTIAIRSAMRVSRSSVTAVECWAPPKSGYLPDSVPIVSIDSDQISGIKSKKYYLPDRDNAIFVPVNSTRGQITPLSCYLAEVDTSLVFDLMPPRALA